MTSGDNFICLASAVRAACEAGADGSTGVFIDGLIVDIGCGTSPETGVQAVNINADHKLNQTTTRIERLDFFKSHLLRIGDTIPSCGGWPISQHA
jgi:hypothetical protein